ncbi:MAG: TetR/AcrR family transcriptional regulator [Halioglobus sp.]
MNPDTLDKPEIGTGGNTRQRLLLTALQLYARDGLRAVSLRSISAAAGSKNSAAMHYHFGNKLGVIDALVQMIAEELDTIATDIQQQAPTRGSLREEFRKSLLPLVTLSRSQPWGADAVRFLSRAISETDPEILTAINPVSRDFWQKVDKNLTLLVPELPDEIRQLRLMFMSINVVHGIAETASLAYTPLGDLSHLKNEQLLDHLVDYLIGGLMAPSHVGNPFNTERSH